MVQAMINIGEDTNRVLNIVKAQYGLKDKSEAIDLVVGRYEEGLMEPQLRPEYVEELKRVAKGKHIRVGSITDLRKRYEK